MNRFNKKDRQLFWIRMFNSEPDHQKIKMQSVTSLEKNTVRRRNRTPITRCSGRLSEATMKEIFLKCLVVMLAVSCLNLSINTAFAAEIKAKSKAKFYVDLRLRYEAVEQNNVLEDADALTLRTRLGFESAEYSGLSTVVEIEDSRSLFGIDDFSVPPTGFNPGVFSVIADPDTTELDQGFVQYKSNGFMARLGRQVITFDNLRFIGHVGFRQDRQTFDGLTLSYKTGKKLSAQLSQLTKRNRIFSDDRDIDSEDTFLNISYVTKIGKVAAYAYLLEEDNASQNSNDTFGIRLSGASKYANTQFLYSAEFALQESNNTIDTDYISLEGGTVFTGITAKVGLELLGSDNGKGAFATPLATLHKFNGWTDQFLSTPAQGLQDLYLSFSGKLAGGGWSATYHNFSSDVSISGNDDLGDEINLAYTRKFGDHYLTGIKYGDYSAGALAFGKVDTNKFWVWAEAKF